MKTWIKFLMGAIGLLIIAVTVACINVATGSSVMVAGLVLTGFTEEQTKSFETFLNKQSEDIQNKVKGLLDTLKDTELIKGIQTLLNGDGTKAGIVGNVTEMQKQLDQIATDLAKQSKEGETAKEKSFLEDLSVKLKAEIGEFKKFKSDPTYRKEVTIQVKNFLETANASVTTGALIPWPERELGVAKAPDRMPKLMNLVDVGAVMSSTIYWVERKTRTDQTQWVAEGVAPTDQVVLGYNTVSQAVKNVASFIKVSNDSLDDIDYLIGEIRSELVTLMMLKVDNDILLGTIALNGYDGIDALATAFAVPGGFKLNAGDIANNKDVLRAAITQVQNANFMPDVILINPNSAMEMDLERDADGAYVIPPFATLDYTRIKGIQVVESAICPADTFYVGNFKKAKLLVRKDAELKVWDQNDTDPVDQLKTVTMYMRLALRIKGPDKLAFVKGTFTAGKAALNVV